MLSDELPLATSASSPWWAAFFVYTRLERWGLTELYPEAPEVAAELVTNAVTEVEAPAYVVLRVWTLEVGRLRVEVWNSSGWPPVNKSGVLEGKAAGYFLPHTGGKVVWCEVVLKPSPSPRAPLF